MTEEAVLHQVTVDIVQAPPAEVDIGTFTTLRVRAVCAAKCDLKEQLITIVDQDGLVIKKTGLTRLVVASKGPFYETDTFSVKLPTAAGEYTWKAIFLAQEKEGAFHQESSASFSFTVSPRHATSIAVWDLSSPVVASEKLNLKVGLRCSAGCSLEGKQIEIYDHEGDKLATKELGDVPWSSTHLYWKEVELAAPEATGDYTWKIKFPNSDSESSHRETSLDFGFKVVRSPECMVTIEVIDHATGCPVNNASVIMNVYREKTSEDGIARLNLPKGEYQLFITKEEYETYKNKVNVTEDLNMKVELLLAPVVDPCL